MPLTADFELDEPAMLEAIERHRPALIYIAYPNNPTANLFDEAIVERIVAAVGARTASSCSTRPTSRSRRATWMPRLRAHPHVLVMRTLSKFGLAGVRLGYLCGAARADRRRSTRCGRRTTSAR